MNRADGLCFLRENQPLPSDNALTEGLIRDYDSVRKFFLESKDPDCIPLFLGSFGEGSGFGVYQLVEAVLLVFPPEEVVPHLRVGLSSEHKGVRYWCAQIASAFPDHTLVSSLNELLSDVSADTRLMAATALGEIGGSRVEATLGEALRVEADGDVKEAIVEALEEARTKS